MLSHRGILSSGMWVGKYPDILNIDNFLTAISHPICINATISSKLIYAGMILCKLFDLKQKILSYQKANH